MNLSSFQKIGVKQIDQADCGVACILTVLNYFGIQELATTVRTTVGKTSSGATFLGLQEGLKKYGIQSEGYEATPQQLAEVRYPCILHTVLENKFLHFIVFFKVEGESFIIFDPAKGLIQLSASELEEIWKSRRVLVIESEPQVSQSAPPKKQNTGNVYVRMFSLFNRHQELLIGAGILGIFVSILGLSVTIFTQTLLDRFLVTDSANRIVVVLASIMVLLILRALLNFLRTYLLLKQSRAFSSHIVESFFGKLMFLSLGFFESKSSGDLISRMHDTIRIQSLMTTFFGQTIMDFFILISATSLLFFYSTAIGVSLLVVIVIFILLSFLSRKRILSNQKQAASFYALNESVFIDSISGFETIKSYAREKQFTSLIRKSYADFQSQLMRLSVFKTRISFGLEVLGAVITVVIFLIAVRLFIVSSITLGEMVAILQLTLIVQPSLLQIFVSSAQVQEAVTAFERMQEYTELLPESSTHEAARIEGFEKVEVSGLHYKYPGRLPLITDLGFSIKKGEILLMRAPSGKGKTTIFKLLQKFYLPTAGSIIFNDSINIENIKIAELRNRIGYVPQDIKIFNGSLLYNISLDENEDVSKVIAFCDEVGLTHEIQKIPDGYGALIGEGGIRLSGGQRQLIGFVRALYKKPDILLLDEATSSMDRDMEVEIQKIVARLLPGMCVMVSSHRSEWDTLATKEIRLI